MACTNEEPNSGTNSGDDGGTGEYYMEGQGEAKIINIPVMTNWYAESDSKWLQLSQMGGNGGDEVTILAAYNTTKETRTGTISIYDSQILERNAVSFRSTSAASPAQVITVTQEPSDSEVMPPCFTEFWFEDGIIYVTVFGGEEGGQIHLPTDGESDFLLKEPSNFPSLAISVSANKSKTLTPYIPEYKSELCGYFTVGGIRTANNIVLRQGSSIKQYNDMTNEGSAVVHYVYGNKLYFGGGLVSEGGLSGTVQYPTYSNQLLCYDPATGDIESLPGLPNSDGNGFGYDNKLFFVDNGGYVYFLDGYAWENTGFVTDGIIAVQINDNTLYAITDDGLITYNVSKKDGKYIFTEISAYKSAINISDEAFYTTDEGGNVWLLDNENKNIIRIENGKLVCTKIENEDFVLVGAEGGYVYASVDTKLYKISADGNKNMLTVSVQTYISGNCENVGGEIFSFGGKDRHDFNLSWFAVKEFKSFTPSKYVPMSLSIEPAE